MRTFALRCRWRQELVAGLALFFCFAAYAAIARADDAPAHRAARLSFLQGEVVVDHLDNTAGDAAQINMPLAEGSRLNTGEDGQAEVEFEDGSVIRITPNSAVGLASLSVDPGGNFRTQLIVLHGLVYAELRATDKFGYSVDAGGMTVSPVANATVRINLDQPPPVVAVLDGTAHVEHESTPEAGGYKTDVHAGEALTGDTSDSGHYFLLQSFEKDSWDEWNQERDQAAADAAANRTTARDNYAGDEGYGWSDLDANGSWYDVPGQGQVWQPTAAEDADFDPYGYGSWVAYPVTGYVWASGYIWGWTPFRCGSWSYWNGFGWGWSPAAGCRRRGWGFGNGVARGVYAINIVHTPWNYRLPTRPIHEPGMLHPIPVGHAPQQLGTGLHPSHEPRLIAGVPVEPLRPVGTTSAPKNRSVTGAALRNDFAVDPATRRPVSGMLTTPAAATARGDFRSAPPRPVTPPAAVTGVELPRPIHSSSVQMRSGYAAQAPAEHSASPPSVPVYAPRSVRPPSSPPPPPTGPGAAAPSAPRGNSVHPN